MKTTFTNFKKNKYMLFFLTLFMMISYTSFSQDSLMVFPDWMSSEGSQNFFYRNVTKTDAVSNVYIVGATINGSGNTDILVAKYNSSGVLQWSNQYDGTGNGEDMGTGLYIDGSGNVYITGTTQTSSTDADIITIKYNSSGTQQWLSTYDGTGNSYDSGSEIVVDNGDVYITGSSYNSTPNTDVIAIKYNSSGTQQWATAYNYTSNLNDAGVKISVNSTWAVVSCIIQTGTTSWKWGTINFNKTTGAYSAGRISASSSTGIDQVNDMVEDASGNIYIVGATPVFGQGYNYDIIKLTSTLSLAWENTYNSSNLDDIAKGIRVDASGNVYVTGYTTSSTEGKNITTIKYNSSGTQQWIETYNDTLDEDDEAYAMEIDASGNIYVTGYETTKMDQADYFTIKYDASGNEIWKIHNDGQKHLNDKSTNIAIDTNGDIVISGSSETAPGEYEYLTVKYVEKNIIIPADYDDESPNSSFSYYKNFGQLINTDGDSIPDIIYYAKNSSPEFYFKDNSYSMVFAKVDTVISTEDTLHRIDVAFSKSNPNAKTYSLEETKSYHNYFLAQCPEGITEVYGNQRLVTTDIYSDIDVMYSSNQNGIKMYFIVKPGGDPTEIMMEYDGESSFNLDGTSNELTINSSIGDITFERPSIYQLDEDNVVVDTFTVWTPAWYTDSTDNYYKFNVGSYNTDAPLIIQVDLGHSALQQQIIGNLDWSTYYGGSVPDGFNDVKTDIYHNVYITGYTSSDNFPTYQGPSTVNYFHGDVDATILKFNQYGILQFATFYGGTMFDIGRSIYTDNNSSNIYVVGGASSEDLPINPINQQPAGAYVVGPSSYPWGSGFILELNEFGNQIIWNTCYKNVYFNSITGDSDNNLYVVGYLAWPDTIALLNLSGAYYNDTLGDGAITKFTKQGERLWATRYNLGVDNGVMKVRTDNSNNVFITGTTSSNLTPVADPGSGAYYDNTLSGSTDVFITKFNTSNAIVWSTYFGGSSDESGKSLCLSDAGDVFITGSTKSTNFPYYNPGSPAYCDSTLSGIANSYISRFSNNGNRLWSTYHGNSSYTESGNDIVIRKGDQLFVTGSTQGLDTLNLSGAYYQNTISNPSSNPDAFILSFNYTDNSRVWDTYFGGSEGDVGYALAVDQAKLYLVGNTSSQHYVTPAFPIVDLGNGAWIQWEICGNYFLGDGFIARFDMTYTPINVNETSYSPENIIIYPNPGSGVYHLKIDSKTNETIKISVYNILGKELFNFNSECDYGINNKVIDLSLYPDGIYLIKVNIAGKESSGKIIKYRE